MVIVASDGNMGHSEAVFDQPLNGMSDETDSAVDAGISMCKRQPVSNERLLKID